MAAKLLRKLSQSALSSAAGGELNDVRCCRLYIGGHDADGRQYKKLEEDMEAAAYDCRHRGYTTTTTVKGKKVPKGYMPVLVRGRRQMEDDEDDEDEGGGDVSDGRRCTCLHLPRGCGCGCSWQVYVIRVRVLGHPLLGDLLRRSWQQFGYSEYAGALRLPCDSHTFENLLTLITTSS